MHPSGGNSWEVWALPSLPLAPRMTPTQHVPSIFFKHFFWFDFRTHFSLILGSIRDPKILQNRTWGRKSAFPEAIFCDFWCELAFYAFFGLFGSKKRRKIDVFFGGCFWRGAFFFQLGNPWFCWQAQHFRGFSEFMKNMFFHKKY